MGGRRQTHRARQDQTAVAGDDPVGRPHRAAAVGGRPGRSQARAEERHAPRFATRPYRHGGERPGARPVLDAVGRLAESAMMAKDRLPIDWRLVATWTVLLV